VQNEIVHTPQAAFWKPEAWTSCGSNDSLVLVVYLVEVNGNNIVMLDIGMESEVFIGRGQWPIFFFFGRGQIS